MSVAQELNMQVTMIVHEVEDLLTERDRIDSRIQDLHRRLGVLERSVPLVQYAEESIKLQTGGM